MLGVELMLPGPHFTNSRPSRTRGAGNDRSRRRAWSIYPTPMPSPPRQPQRFAAPRSPGTFKAKKTFVPTKVHRWSRGRASPEWCPEEGRECRAEHSDGCAHEGEADYGRGQAHGLPYGQLKPHVHVHEAQEAAHDAADEK